ncbi:hypothetical protein LCGC14_0450830 [marine sediment metagenome]|uniref:Uncharacterized protein n=1 Tax=marine sediment metagenome TaxID=412755 RepID=A0A0F9T101_9ZZZZ
MISEQEKPTKANRPEIPKGNKFSEMPQGRKAKLPRREKFNKVIVDMKPNGDFINLVVDLENEKGVVVARIKSTVSNIVVSSRPSDKAEGRLDAELERIEEQFHRKKMCTAKCLIGHNHNG